MRALVRFGLIAWMSAAGPALAESGIAQPESPPWSIAEALDVPASVKLSGSVRLRYEDIDGQSRPNFNNSDQLTNLRTTLFGEVASGPLKFGAELYDSRAYGGNSRSPVTTNEVNAFELVQAYAIFDIAAPFGKSSAMRVQAGRFVLNLGSRRLIASDDYRNTTNGFTGVHVDVTGKNGLQATLIYTLPQIRLPDDQTSLLDNRVKVDGQSFDTVLWGALVTKKRAIGPVTAEAAFYHFGESDAPGRATRNRSLNNIDVRLIRDPSPGKPDYEMEGIYQFGHIAADLTPAAARLKLSAWFAHADIGYTFAHPWKPHLVAEFDIASGDGPSATYARFDPIFGMRRADFGPAGLYNAITRSNIVTPGIRIEMTPSHRADAFFSYRAMWTESSTDAFATTGVRDPAGASGSFAGHQFETRVRYWLVQNALRFEADGNLLVKGRLLRQAPNAPRNGDTRYLALNLTAFF